ncbi:MAG: GHKL domain-containing protein [Pseudomonadales bacterium]|nr:GHKL domain-containing protein [Pseudomonadales bacterium]
MGCLAAVFREGCDLFAINRKSVLVFTAMVLSLLLFSSLLTRALVFYGEDKERDHLLQLTRLAAASLDINALRALKGNESDLHNPVFFEIKSRLLHLKTVDPSIEYIYLMGRRNGRVFFYVDADSENSQDDAFPGEVYTEASAALSGIFENGEAFVEGPMKDKWGMWVSGIAPVFDPQGGELLMVIGMDIEATDWSRRVNVYRSFAMIICTLFIVLVLGFYFYSFHIQRARFLLQKEIDERIKLEKQKQLVENLIRHDIRNPLNGVMGFAQMLKNDELNDQQKHYLRQIEASAHKIMHLVNHHLDLDRIEHGDFELVPERVELVSMILSVAEEQTVDCDVSFDLKLNALPVDKTQAVYIKGMDTLCYSMLANLLSNAVNAAEQKEVLQISIDEKQAHVLVSLKNRQPVPVDIRSQFFEKYKTSSHGAGYGLGTYSAWLMAKAMHAEIAMHSDDESGTEITVRFKRWVE